MSQKEGSKASNTTSKLIFPPCLSKNEWDELVADNDYIIHKTTHKILKKNVLAPYIGIPSSGSYTMLRLNQVYYELCKVLLMCVQKYLYIWG
jgi:hypothetical protein